MAAPFGEEWFNQPFDVGVIFGPELRPVDRFRPVPVLYPVSSRVNVRIVRQRIVSTRSRPSFTVAFRRFPEADPRPIRLWCLVSEAGALQAVAGAPPVPSMHHVGEQPERVVRPSQLYPRILSGDSVRPDGGVPIGVDGG